jgi:hypothetical protein
MSLADDIDPNDLPASPSPDVNPAPPPSGWMQSGNDVDQIRAVQAAARERMNRVLSSGPQFVPAPPQQAPTGWMGHPADDGLVARVNEFERIG